MTSGTPSQTAVPQRRSKGPAVVLCSRGFSFERRLRKVVEYAQRNAVRNVILLHCPERRYSEPLVREVTERAERLFEDINADVRETGEDELTFELLFGKGTLHENLLQFLDNDVREDIMTVFVGMKMLDYRLEEIKKLDTALYFIGD
jgi:hypothetical protein